jgi:hypothetical protein
VSFNEIDPKTMESRIVKRLFFAGEVLNIDGDTGGYNLQFAFSSGVWRTRGLPERLLDRINLFRGLIERPHIMTSNLISYRVHGRFPKR